MVVDIAGLTLISIMNTASCCISELIKTAYKNRNSSSIYMNTINQFTNATLKDLHTCSLTKFNNKKLAFMNSHNVYIWSDWGPLPEICAFLKNEIIFLHTRLSTVSTISCEWVISTNYRTYYSRFESWPNGRIFLSTNEPNPMANPVDIFFSDWAVD